VPAVDSSSDFATFIALYRAAGAVLTTEEAMFRLFREIAEDAAADGGVWVETHVDTTLHLGRLGSSHMELLELFVACARAAAADTGVGVGLIVSADRTLDPAIAVEQAEAAAAYDDGCIVGFGLANDEAAHPPEPFAEAFDIVRDEGLLLVPHAGELAGPESVVAALDVLDPDRLGHGVRAVESPAVLQRLADEGMCCDMCPTSNLTLRMYPSIAEHPIGAFLAAGVPVTINADDPLMFGSGLLAEYTLVRDGLGLPDETMAAIARTSIDRSGMLRGQSEARAAVDAWLAS
jgi:adenosine deaminase